MHTIPVAVITGAGSGIGRAAAIMLAQLGYALVLVGRTPARLTETAALTGAGEQIEVVGGDVGDPFQCKHVVARAVERFGRLDALVNNAGLAPLSEIDQTPPDQIERVYRVNALAPAWAIHYAWPVFKRQQSGVVVNVSTIGSFDPFPGFFAYAAAKAAVNVMAASVAKEGTTINVRGFAIAPGAVETDMLRGIFDEKTLPADQCLQPGDVARVIVECITGRRDHQNGKTIPVLGPGADWYADWLARNPQGLLTETASPPTP
jgi:NAD(P)-dependent dehydrogenase (short-subunit alcohol dehydrogenase family)